jgi:predicted alpha/beta-hydrolase family hydrolase
MERNNFQVTISPSLGEVSASLVMPSEAIALLVLSHGAGAGMNHRFMVSLSEALAERKVATLRYNFVYMERGKKMVDPPAIAHRTVDAVVEKARSLYPAIPVFAGGKSFGGRMTSQYIASTPGTFVKGIVFYGFPLHPDSKPDITRAEHLSSVQIPMLFLQGTADKLAYQPLIEGVCNNLPTATLKKFEGADHSFKAGKKEFISELADETLRWMQLIIG